MSLTMRRMESRRTFLRLTTSFLGASALGQFAAHATGAPGSSSGSRRRQLPVVILFNAGGPSQFETFSPSDPKTPVELRGSAKPIPTRIPGVSFAEYWPKLAERNDRFSLLRGLDSMSSSHDESMATMLRPGGADTFGIQWGERAADGGVPYAFVEVPSNYPPLAAVQRDRSLHIKWERAKDAPAIAGPDWQAALEGEGRFAAPSFRADPGLRDRVSLLRAFESGSTLSGPAVERRDRNTQLAIDLMLGGGEFFEAFTPRAEERREYERDLDRYGRTSRVGQGLLLARRLAQRGAGVAMLYNERGMGWDMHSGLFNSMPALAAETDQAFAALLDDLREGRFEGVVMMVGEFGRTPQVNGSGGRDHWGTGFPGIVAGGTVRRGVVHGEITARGEIRSGRVPASQLVPTITVAAGGEIPPTTARVREILEL